VSVGAGDVSKILMAVAALVAAVGGFVVAVGGDSSDSPQVPAVIIIRGSVLDDGLSDSEADREWLWDESS
jgi:hypothetical protein